MVHEELDTGAALNAQITEGGEPAARIGGVAIRVNVRNVDSGSRSVEKGAVCRHNLPGARIPGAPFDEGEARCHAVDVEGDVGEARVGQEMRVDGRISSLELQFHDCLEDCNLRMFHVREHPRLYRGAAGEECKATQTPSRGSFDRIREDVDRRSENLFLREEDCDSQLLCRQRP